MEGIRSASSQTATRAGWMIARRILRDTKPYGLAVLTTAAALVVTIVLDQFLPVPPLILFAAPVVVASRYGGPRTAFVASALSIVAMDVAFLPPVGHVELTHPQLLIYAGVFALVALTISAPIDALKTARRAAERQAEELEDLNTELEQQMEEVQALSEELQDANQRLELARAEADRVAARAVQLQQVTAALSKARSVQDVADAVMRDGLATLQAVRGCLFTITQDGEPRLAGCAGFPPAFEERLRTLSLDDDFPSAVAMRTRVPVWLRSPGEIAERFPDLAAAFGPSNETHTAILAIPLLRHETLVGGLSLGFNGPHALGVADDAFTSLLAGATAEALERARSFDEEREGRRAAEAAAGAREEVLAIVAHDLRNPLNLVGMTTELLLEVEPSGERRVELLQVMQRAVRQMNRLIGDLLDVVRLEAGRLSLDLRTADVRAILAQTAEMFRQPAAGTDVELAVDETHGDLRVCADAERVVQVLGNLVGNAVKFVGRHGRVSIGVAAAGHYARFSVADTGPGIPPDQLERLFDRFWQARRSDRRGVGLGLTISRGIVEAHGGRIWVESSPGAGTTFYFTVPLADRVRPLAGRASERRAEPGDSRRIVARAPRDAGPDSLMT